MQRPREFYELSEVGDATGQDRDRSSFTLKLDNPTSWRLVQGRRVGPDFPQIVVEMDTPDPVEDMPWGEMRGQLVSNRFRNVVERSAPGHAQFLPAVLKHRGRPIDAKTYWMINWLHMVDCFDPRRSVFTEIPDSSEAGGVRLDFDRIVIDSRRVPSTTLAFRVARWPLLVLIRRSLRGILESAGMTGCQFYEVEQT